MDTIHPATQQDLFPDELREQLPPLHFEFDKDSLPLVPVHYLAHGWHWYPVKANAVTYKSKDRIERPLLEVGLADMHDILFFGYVKGDAKELGYFSFSMLRKIHMIVRDEGWSPVPIQEVTA